METLLYKEGGATTRKLRQFRHKLFNLTALLIAISAPTFVFLYTCSGWLSIATMLVIGLSFGRVTRFISKLQGDDSLLSRLDKLTSIGGYPYVN